MDISSFFVLFFSLLCKLGRRLRSGNKAGDRRQLVERGSALAGGSRYTVLLQLTSSVSI
jgi:hypothetical protein